MRIMILLIVSWVFLFTVGCQPNAAEPRSTPVPNSTDRNGSQMTPISTPSNAQTDSLINKAKQDLAQRLSIPVEQVNLVEVTEVEWSDSSLDCPEPGMSYLQVITPGYRILLEVNSQVHEYHSNKDTYLVYCSGSDPMIPPKP